MTSSSGIAENASRVALRSVCPGYQPESARWLLTWNMMLTGTKRLSKRLKLTSNRTLGSRSNTVVACCEWRCLARWDSPT